MKRVISSLVATIASLVVLLGFKTHAPEVAAPSASTASSSVASGASSATTVLSTRSSATATSSVGGSRTVTGDAASTRWGPVQVRVALSGSRITAVDVLAYPKSNPRDVSINEVAVPRLISQALAAQSAEVAGVSGATYTTQGFIESLQSALARA